MPTKIVTESIGRTIDTVEDGVAATRRLLLDADLLGTTGVFFDKLAGHRAAEPAYEPQFRR